METQLIVAPKNNTGVVSDLNDDTIVCKYVTHFCKRENDDETIFPGKPSNIKRTITKNSILYSYSQKFYNKETKKISVVRDLTINASLVKKNDTYQLDVKYIDALDKKTPGNNNLIIKKQNIIDILNHLFEGQKK